MEIYLPRKPAGCQVAYFKSASRFNVAVFGRQTGKSTTAQTRLFVRGLPKPGRYYWISNVFRQADIQFGRFYSDYRNLIRNVNRSNRIITLLNGSDVMFFGADRPDLIKGDTIDGAVLDECGTMKPTVWYEVIRPMLAVKQGWADFIGTPKGKNWYFELSEKAKALSDWSYFHASSFDSPFFKDSRELLEASTPERIFRQEFLAEFLEDGGEVFRGIKECISGEYGPPHHARHYVMGVDLAKVEDYTVITVWDTMTNHMVRKERWQKVDYILQEERIISIADQYNNALIYIEINIESSLYERLVRRGARVQPVVTTNASKAWMIEALSIAIERREITFPNDPEIISELSTFGIETTRHGNIRYCAPEGLHDDIVMSMAIAVAHFTRRSAGGIELVGETESSKLA